MRKLESVFKLVTSSSDYIKWLGLVSTNITDHNLYSVIAIDTMADFIESKFTQEDVLDELCQVISGAIKMDVTNTYIVDKVFVQEASKRWS